MLHFNNTEMPRTAMAMNTTAAASPSNTTSSTSFSLTQFETELSSLVNGALQAAGVSPSEASFSFNPTTSSSSANTGSSAATSSSTAPPSSSTSSSSTTTTSGTESQTNGATGNGQSDTTADWITLPMLGRVNIEPLIAAQTAPVTQPRPPPPLHCHLA